MKHVVRDRQHEQPKPAAPAQSSAASGVCVPPHRRFSPRRFRRRRTARRNIGRHHGSLRINSA
ncbi:MAG: hypothetical protein ACLUEQ_01475 [Cloacibacillus evryensis]